MKFTQRSQRGAEFAELILGHHHNAGYLDMLIIEAYSFFAYDEGLRMLSLLLLLHLQRDRDAVCRRVMLLS